jgi:hypothetical protein
MPTKPPTPPGPAGESLPAADLRIHRVEVAAPPARALAEVARLAGDWGGEWQAEGAAAGRLALPVSAGLRRGWVAGPVEAAPTGDGSRLLFREEAGEYHLDRAAVATLVLAGFGAAVTLVAPFVPRLLPLLPMSVVLALGAWFFIVARLRNSGPEEFFGVVADAAVAEAADGDATASSDQ